METRKSELGWSVSAHIVPTAIKGKQISRATMSSAIWQALKAKPWLTRSSDESRPAKLTLSRIDLQSDGFVLNVGKNLKSSQLYDFHLYLHELVRELISMDIPDIDFIIANVGIRGKTISLSSR